MAATALDAWFRSLEVCELSRGVTLMTNVHGWPWYRVKYDDGRWGNYAVYEEPRPQYSAAIDAWQRDPWNDCLRARGDKRWHAASIALSHWDKDTRHGRAQVVS